MERKAAVPPFSSVQHVQEKTQPLKETPAAQMNKKLQTTAGRWSVQIHATRDEGAAQQLARQLRTQGYAPAISKVVRDGEVWYRVRVGSFTNADEARASVGRLRKEGKFSQAYPVSN
jgi:cell division septation protein DedD